MATIKSYTDLDQSNKLAEILPLETADMHYNNGSYRGVDYTEHFSAELMPYQEALHLMKIHKTNFMFQVVPCWSLAALFKLLPKSAQLEKGNVTELCRVMLPIELEASDWYVEPIDACYEMILKLHELKML